MPPRKLPRACAYPGCPEVIREGRYCPKHKTVANREYNSTARRADYTSTYNHRWRVLRDLYLSKHPLCEACLKSDKLVPAVLVHQIVPIENGGTHEESNLMSLCHSCHNKIHRRG